MSSTRRDFLVGGLSAGAAVPLLGGGAQLAPKWMQAAAGSGPGDQVTVIIQLSGGWDWMNLMVPADAGVYYKARPNTGIPKNKTLGRIDNKTATATYWHPAVQAFKDLYGRGDLALVQNVGYPKPNLSHFRSYKKWHSADPAATTVSTGWLANWLKKGYTGGFSIPALNIDRRLNPAFATARVPVLRSLSTYKINSDTKSPSGQDKALELQLMESNAAVLRPTAAPTLQFLTNSTEGAFSDSRTLPAIGANYVPKATYPSNAARFTSDLQLAARLISGGLKSDLYYLNVGGWDHHANQVLANDSTQGKFATMTGYLSAGIKAFIDDMKAWGKDKNVVVMVFSEFGRRVGQNGSLGCDHGHGGLALMAGTPVTGGTYGTYPDMTKVKTPYSRYYLPFDGRSTDFRSLYATLLEKWMGAKHGPILGGKFPLLGCLP